MSDLSTIISQIREHASSNFSTLMVEFRQNGTKIVLPTLRLDEFTDIACEVVIQQTNGRADAWGFFDFILKNTTTTDEDSATATTNSFLENIKTRIIPLCVEFAYKQMTPQQFKPYAESFKLIFGSTIGTLLTLKLKGAEKTAASASASAASTGPSPYPLDQQALTNNNEDSAAPDFISTNNHQQNNNTTSNGSGALVVHKNVANVGGFAIQTTANNKREMGHAGALQVKTRDAAQAINQAAMYAPAAPAEIALQHVPERDRHAPIGFMKAEFAQQQQQNTESYRSQRKGRLGLMLKKMREQEEDGGNNNNKNENDVASDRRPERNQEDGSFISYSHQQEQQKIAQALHGDDIVLPTEFPRDDFGVKIGYYPEGVRFLRDAIRGCGGAIELTVLENRIVQLVDDDTKHKFGDLRQFLNIHRPTFTVRDEEDDNGKKLWVVRLSADLDKIAQDETGNSHIEPTWLHMTCPHCGKVVPGRNFARHEHCRKCVKTQIALGMSLGRFSKDGRSPIMDLAAAAQKIMSTPKDDLDDDDVAFFATCTEKAAQIPRFRHGPERHFAPVLKALRVLRNRFLQNHGAASFDAVTLSDEDGVYARLFRIWGENMLRLPIPWIDTGDVIDMVHRFTSKVHQPALPPPRAGDPRITVGNTYPGFLLAESDTDVDDQTDDPEEDFSDDEAPSFHFAPPVTPMETVMAAGLERETKKLTYKLHTAPPVLAQQVITQTDGSGTLRDVHNTFKQH